MSSGPLTPVWINGSLCAPGDAHLSVFDHGILVGDGVFETVLAIGRRPFALRRHLERLAASARGLGLPEPDREGIRRAVLEVLAAAPAWERARVRITFTSGPGPIGSDRGAEGPTTIVAAREQQPFAALADVWTVPWPRNERGALAGLKTTSYAENAKALAYARERGGSEALFGNLAGNLCEGTGSNVFLVEGSRLVTPPLSAGCLAGVTRALILEWVGGEERNLPLAALAEAEEAFLASTTREVQPIELVNGRQLPAAPGPLTRKVMDAFTERARADLDP